jgi:hypothetical protein
MDLSAVVAAVLALVPAQYAVYVLAVCGLCAVIAALWPRPPANSSWLPLYQLVNALGGNFAHAKNKNAPSAALAPTDPAVAIPAPPAKQ